MRKGRDGGEKKSEKVKKKKKENNGGNSGHYVLASRPPNGDRLQRRRSCQKWKKKIMVKIVATASLPVDHLTATDCNAAARANSQNNQRIVLMNI